MEERIQWLQVTLAPRIVAGEVVIAERPRQTADLAYVAELFADAIDAAMGDPGNAYDILKSADGGTRGYGGVFDACHAAGTL